MPNSTGLSRDIDQHPALDCIRAPTGNELVSPYLSIEFKMQVLWSLRDSTVGRLSVSKPARTADSGMGANYIPSDPNSFPAVSEVYQHLRMLSTCTLELPKRRPHNMDQQELEGLRLLSFDGGDIRAVSQLIILDEFMRRVEWDNKAENRILPCEYFHMMAGVGTGGIIIFLLVVLSMSIEEAIEEFIIIWHTVYMDATLEPRARSIKLENVLKDLLRRKGIQENQAFSTPKSSCKAFVCAVPESNLGLCEKFRNYKSKETSTAPTIVEAIRATCAIPTLFTSVTIESVGCNSLYTTGAFKFNNPAGELLKEACGHLGRNTRVTCMLSLGCTSLPAHQSNIMDLASGIMSDSDLLEVELAWRIGRSGAYYRLSARQPTQTLRQASSNSVEMITAATKGFLSHPDVVEKVNQSVEASRRRGGVPLAEISGLSERKPAAAHGLPSLSASFVARPALIKTIAGYLLQSGPPAQRTIVLSGLGGIGKTQITISFLLQFLAIFRHVLFIDGSSVQTIESGLVAKVKSFGSAYSRTTAKEALDVLENPDHEITRDWAIVYDNVDNPRVRIATYFPKCAFGTIFITTRNPKLGNLAPNTHLRLDTMSEEEAVDVLLKSAIQPPRTPTDEERKHARDIAKELGYLPVALVQAGYFIQIHDCMADYSRRLRKRRLDILKRPAEHQRDEHYHGVYATLEVTWPYLSDRARKFMSILGFVNYTGFPLVLISRAVSHGFLFEPFVFMSRADTFQETVELLCSTFMPQEEWDQQDIDDLVEELERYSLVTRMNTFMLDTLRLHPLVHSWVHDRLSNTEREVYQAAAVRLLVSGTGDTNEDIFEFIYPHVTSWSARFGSMHLNDLGGLARIFAHQGDHTAAIALWERVFRETCEKYGVDDLRTSEAKLQLAAGYRTSKESKIIAVADIMEREVVKHHTRTLGPAHPITIKALMQQARSMAQSCTQRRKAISMLRSIVYFWQDQRHEDRESMLQAKEALASALFEQSAQDYVLFKRGEPNMEAVMQIYTEILQDRMAQEGNDHHATVKATESLAVVYEWYTTCLLGKDEPTINGNAIQLWTSAVSARTKRRGPHSPDILDAINGNAAQLWTAAVSARTKIRGPHHPDTLDAMERLALSYYFRGSYEVFVDKLAQLFVLRRNAQGASHEKVAAMKERLVGMESASSGHIERHILRKGVIILMKAMHGCAHKDTLEVVQKFAREWWHYGEAIGWWKESLALLKEIQGPLNEDTLKALVKYATACERARHSVDAIVQWKIDLAVWQDLRGERLEDTTKALEKLSYDCEGWADDKEAHVIRKVLLSLRKDIKWLSHEEIVKYMETFARDSERCSEYEDAIAQWKEILALQKDIQGTTHGGTLRFLNSLAWTCIHCDQNSVAIAQWKAILTQTKELHSSAYKGTVEAMETFARECEERRQNEGAMGWWRECLILRKEIQGPQHENTINSTENLAAAYERLGKYEEAIVHRKELLALRKELQGTNHKDTLSCMESLAQTYHMCGHHEMAVTQWRDVISQTKELRGSACAGTIEAFEKLACECERRRQPEGAIEWWKEALALRKAIQGPRHDDAINSTQHLVTSFERLGDYKEAIVHRKELLVLRKELQGPNHEDTLSCMESLARAYHMIGQSETAITYWKDLVVQTKRSHGRAHEKTINCIERFAHQCGEWRDHKGAIELWEEALALRKGIQGASHGDILLCMESLARAYHLCGQHEMAITQWKDVVVQTKELHGRAHEETIKCIEKFALQCGEWRDCKGAIELWKEALALRKETQKPQHENTVNSMENLAAAYEDDLQYREAILQWKETLYLREDFHGAKREATLGCMKSLAVAYQMVGQREAAITRWKDVVFLTKEIYGRTHEDTINCMKRSARVCGHWGHYKEARAQWEEILGLLKETRGPRHEDTLNAMEECATACGDLDEYDEALVQEMLALRKQIQGIDHYNTRSCMCSLAEMYERLHLHDEAEAQWKELMAAGETWHYKYAKHNLFRLYKDMGRKEEANSIRLMHDRMESDEAGIPIKSKSKFGNKCTVSLYAASLTTMFTSNEASVKMIMSTFGVKI